MNTLTALFRFRVRGGRINPLLNGRNDVLPFPRMFPPIYGQVTLHGAYHTVPRPGTPLDGTGERPRKAREPCRSFTAVVSVMRPIASWHSEQEIE